ncbi:hypothetical protein L2E82_09022 [Cichorium intybus]|uniref:Uncharacterized protein n=1 Tax=Cichorium intybus TaxID=13427 RepID=A0ACB9G8E8_CICIN|nr:hypothetical protein L2E82_09022 [Cichorium intybus]
MILPTDDTDDDRPPDNVIPSANKSKVRVGVVQQPEMEVEDFECQMKTDGELEEMIPKIKKSILKLGHKLSDKGEKLECLGICIPEAERRMKSLVEKVSNRPPDIAVVTSAEKLKDRVGGVQQPQTKVEDFEYQMKTNGELESTITRLKKNLMTIGHRLPDKGEKVKATLRRCVAEVQRRKGSRVDKAEREEGTAKRMRIVGKEQKAEKKQGNKVKEKLVDAEKKIVQLKAHVLDLQEKLRDSYVQLDAVKEEKKEVSKRLEVAERKCASVADDSKWLLQEGLAFLVQKLVNELSKENFMTLSELRTWHQRSRSDSS